MKKPWIRCDVNLFPVCLTSKTPISMIQGYAEGLKFNIAKNKEDQDYYCEVIIEETDKNESLDS